MKTFGEKVVNFHGHLSLTQKLPQPFKLLNPYKNNPEVLPVLKRFYTKYFDDTRKRQLIVGINPGRLGGGATGIAFTDTKRLYEFCGINKLSFATHEPSSVFVYKVIDAFGGPANFYRSFYINSVCPLGFIRQSKKKNWVNCNYYDDKSLYKAVKPFIISTLKRQIDFGIDTAVCYSLGKKNGRYLKAINAEEKLFDRVIALPHPRYIVQYKSKQMETHIDEYLDVLSAGTGLKL